MYEFRGDTFRPQEDPNLQCVKVKTLLEESLLSWDSGIDISSSCESPRTVCKIWYEFICAFF